MMKMALLGGLCALAFQSNAQYNQTAGITTSGVPYYFLNSDFYPFETKEVVKHYSGKTVEFIAYDKKGKQKHRSQTSLDDKGHVIRVYKFEDDQKHLVSSQYYYKDSVLQEKTSYRNGKMRSSTVLSYTDDFKVLTQENFNRGKLTYASNLNYRDGLLVETKVFTGKKKKMSGRYEFDYFGNKDRKETRIYNGKNKLKSKIRYECKDEGSDELQKNEKMICIYEEGEKDFFKTIQYTKTKKGNQKWVTVYRAKDSSMVEQKSYNEKEELYYQNTYNPDTKKLLSSEHFKKGAFRYGQFYIYNGNQLMEKKYKNKKGQESKTEFTYSDAGAPEGYKRYTIKGELYQSGVMSVAKVE